MSKPDKPTTLYRFFDADQRLLYVGVTLNRRQLRRWSEHAGTKDWWTDVASTTVTHYPSRDQALRAEADAIRSENPLHNISGRPRPMPPPTPTRSVEERGHRRWLAPSGDAEVTLGEVFGTDMATLTTDEVDALAELLVDSDGVARILGLSSGASVRVYRRRFADFPQPLVPRQSVTGKNAIWYLPHVLAWRELHPPRKPAVSE